MSIYKPEEWTVEPYRWMAPGTHTCVKTWMMLPLRYPSKVQHFCQCLRRERGDVMGGTHLAGERMELSLRCP